MARENAWYIRHATLRDAAHVLLGALAAYALLFMVALWAAI